LNPTYHDRIDVDARLNSRQVLALFARSIAYLKPVRRLLGARLGLTAFIFLIGLPLPWFLKLVVDHGVMQQPIEPGMLYPFFMQPFLDAFAGGTPLDITVYALIVLGVLFALVGYAGNTSLEANLAEGADVATQSENKTSAGASFAHGLVGFLDLSVAIRLSQRITDRVRVAVFDKMSRLPLTALQVQRSGDTMFRVMHDSPAIAGICHALTVNPFGMVFSVTLNLWILDLVYGSTAPELVWVGLSAVVVTLVATSPLANWMRRTSQASRASGSATTDDLEEGIKNVAAVQSLGGSAQERAKFAQASRESFRQSLLLLLVKNTVLWIADNVHLIFQTIGFYFIFNGIIDGQLTLGDTPVILRMYSLLYETSMQFGQIWIEQQDNAAAARRVFFMMDAETESTQDATGIEPTTATPPPPRDIAPGIRFENVSFIYPDGRVALRDVSFSIAPGERLAIAGPTGAGKTTLAQLIPGFLKPSSGTVHVGQLDTAALDTADLRRRVAYVFQEHQLLSDTIAANLRVAKPDASIPEMEDACRKAGALEFIDAMPSRFDARISRGGGSLSVGQKQRISIARALLRDAPILILDEPTAALDPRTEAALMDAMMTEDSSACVPRAQRIVIVIAHRLSTIRNADRILFLDRGRIVEEGTHEQLMAIETGRYREFVEIQAEDESGLTRGV
jgi:ABC-type multidrug transport system fused ATPase/permease subunit